MSAGTTRASCRSASAELGCGLGGPAVPAAVPPCRSWFASPFPIAREKQIEQLLPRVEVGRFQRSDRSAKINQTGLRGTVQQAKRTCDVQPPRAGNDNASAIIDEDKSGRSDTAKA